MTNKVDPTLPGIAPVPRSMLRPEEFAASAGMGRTGCFDLMRRGLIKSVLVGRKRLIPISELEAFPLRMLAGA